MLTFNSINSLDFIINLKKIWLSLKSQLTLVASLNQMDSKPQIIWKSFFEELLKRVLSGVAMQLQDLYVSNEAVNNGFTCGTFTAKLRLLMFVKKISFFK